MVGPQKDDTFDERENRVSCYPPDSDVFVFLFSTSVPHAWSSSIKGATELLQLT